MRVCRILDVAPGDPKEKGSENQRRAHGLRWRSTRKPLCWSTLHRLR